MYIFFISLSGVFVVVAPFTSLQYFMHCRLAFSYHLSLRGLFFVDIFFSSLQWFDSSSVQVNNRMNSQFMVSNIWKKIAYANERQNETSIRFYLIFAHHFVLTHCMHFPCYIQMWNGMRWIFKKKWEEIFDIKKSGKITNSLMCVCVCVSIVRESILLRERFASFPLALYYHKIFMFRLKFIFCWFPVQLLFFFRFIFCYLLKSFSQSQQQYHWHWIFSYLLFLFDCLLAEFHHWTSPI